MSKTKILIIVGAVAGLILVVGLAVGLTYQSKAGIKNDTVIFGQDESTSGQNQTADSTSSTSTTTSTTSTTVTTVITTTLSEDDDWGQWSEWTRCSQYCSQARMLRLKFKCTFSTSIK